MKHFDHVDWMLYKSKALDENKSMEMEDHLYSCHTCMGIFLSLIDEEEIKHAAKFIPENFTEELVNKISKVRRSEQRKSIKKPVRKKAQEASNFFLYYAAVASVAIMLTAGGFFTKIVDSVGLLNVDFPMKEKQVKYDAIYNFSESIAGKTSKIINNIGFKKVRED